MSFGITKIVGYIKALSPISHGGDEKTGSETLLRRNKFFINGESMEIPYISGNAIRGYLRREVIADFLKLLDYNLTSARLYHALFAGGILESVSEKDSGKINLELKKSFYDLIAPLRIFGTSYLNQTIEGKLQIGLLLPICKELKEYLPEEKISNKYKSYFKESIYSFRDFKFQTRKDDLREERKEGEQALQMLFKYEVFIPGTIFYHEIKLLDANALDLSLVARMLELWEANAIIGGKSSIGLGKVEIDYNYQENSNNYLEFVQENKEKIVALLESLK